MRDRIAAFYYANLYGEWESMTRWVWVYGHVSILFATALAGYSVARERYLLALLLVPFPVVYLYKRYEKAKTYTVQADTPV
ncbi:MULTISPECIES: hypothetical protein [Haloarcula]|uniref:Uncharacterized protein n=1 Tax=Haloarcula pellucida TaxID=1427151 RepID=A0A830GJX7_9EURY|nr:MULTISPECIES: hypothetical protein [Halomicroarcula]MBX0350398.1 hypothetical protein [Halomicroarcula pellucida]MDS0278761.1 hypothetical protein [Halomicroarcula sp. S1AR25-4]GGN90796.1 hypothetical protein GCM10009030_13120 [Halomicroarcula pellucida]